MNITRVEPLRLDRFLFVRVHTDAGTVGLGESGAWGHLGASEAALHTFGEYLVGRDPDRIEDHWNVMHRFSHFRGAAIMGAVSALDIALWDLKGQRLGRPIYDLLGGRVRERVRVYGHVKAATADEMVAKCEELKGRGFTAVGHLNPFLDEDRSAPYFKSHARKIHDAVEVVRQVRRAVGDDVDLCLELHRRLSPAEAVVFAEAVAPFYPLFLEDPVRPENLDAMASVADKTGVPIATGERFIGLYEFAQLFARGGLRYARVSVCLCGGLTGAKKIAALAEAHGAEVVPHNPLSPVSLAACLQLDACIPNFAIQEYPNSGDGWDTERGTDLRGAALVTHVPRLTNGFIALPEGPGLGTALVSGAEDSPPLPRKVAMRRHLDGSVLEQ